MNSLLKFDGPHLEAVLATVQRELGPDVTIVEANRTRRGGIGGFFAREWFEVVVDPGDADTAGPVSPEPTVTATADADLDDPFLLLAAAVDDVREPAPAPLAPLGDDLGTAPESPNPSFAAALAAVGDAARTGAARVPRAVDAPLPKTAPAVNPIGLAASAVPTPVTPAVPAPVTTRLRDLDLPRMLAHLDRVVPRQLLPTAPAPVVAVVGDRHAVHPTASGVAAQLGLDASDVLVASQAPDPDLAPWLRLSTPEEVASRTDRWRRTEHATVVAVELEPGAEGHAWAARMLAAMAADQVRLVAKAWQLADGLGAKATALGGVDGLELIEMDAAAEPELFLELDLDVVAVDGRPATSELWAALLLERRNDDHHQ